MRYVTRVFIAGILLALSTVSVHVTVDGARKSLTRHSN